MTTHVGGFGSELFEAGILCFAPRASFSHSCRAQLQPDLDKATMSRLHIPPLESNSGPRTVVSPNGAPAAAFGAAPPLSTTSQRGPKQLSDTRYSSVSSSLLSLADDLRDLGVDALLEVPTLVIAGDQSSGKSSVVEAVASVALPRATGTCTRCPTEVRMR